MWFIRSKWSWKSNFILYYLFLAKSDSGQIEFIEQDITNMPSIRDQI